MSDKTKLTRATITRVYEDGSSTDYDIHIHETKDIWIDQGDRNFITVPFYIWGKLNEKVCELIAENKD